MRVLLNALSARLGGGQTYIANLLRHLSEQEDIEVFLLTPPSAKFVIDEPLVKRLSAPEEVNNPFFRTFWERVYLPKLVKELRIDVLFCPGGILGAAAASDCKTVTMFRNMMPFDPVQSAKYPLGYARLRLWLLRRSMLRSMARADKVIFLSRFAAGLIEGQIGGKLKQSVIIPHGVAPEFSAPVEAKAAAEIRAKYGDYFLYVSTLDFYKAQVEVVRAYALLKSRRETRERLLLVGTDLNGYGERVRKAVVELGLQEDVRILGNVPHEQLPALYQNAAVNLFASQCENCPNILLEALAASRPMLVSRCEPMPEFAGDAVLYFDPSSPEQLARQWEHLLSDTALQADLAARARERSKLFDWEVTARETWSAIRHLVAAGPQFASSRSFPSGQQAVGATPLSVYQEKLNADSSHRR